MELRSCVALTFDVSIALPKRLGEKVRIEDLRRWAVEKGMQISKRLDSKVVHIYIDTLLMVYLSLVRKGRWVFCGKYNLPREAINAISNFANSHVVYIQMRNEKAIEFPIHLMFFVKPRTIVPLCWSAKLTWSLPSAVACSPDSEAATPLLDG